MISTMNDRDGGPFFIDAAMELAVRQKYPNVWTGEDGQLYTRMHTDGPNGTITILLALYLYETEHYGEPIPRTARFAYQDGNPRNLRLSNLKRICAKERKQQVEAAR